jgi:hypothetical protein
MPGGQNSDVDARWVFQITGVESLLAAICGTLPPVISRVGLKSSSMGGTLNYQNHSHVTATLVTCRACAFVRTTTLEGPTATMSGSIDGRTSLCRRLVTSPDVGDGLANEY